METLLRIGLSNAVAAVLLALVVTTAACVWRRPALLHALWLLVLVKLVTPPLLWMPEPWATPAAPPAVAEKPPEPPPVDLPLDAVPDSGGAPAEDAAAPPPALNLAFVPDSEPEPETPALTAEEPPAAPVSIPAPAPVAPWWVIAAAGAWLAGSATWYALAVYRLRRFRRLLRHATPAPESLRQRTQRLAQKMRLRRCPAVWLVPGRVAPMLWAAGGQPCILFPSELLELVGVEGQNALLVHELAHLRRRDHWVRWLEFAAAGLYWWHPILWFARRELREAEELCCDAWVTTTLPGAGKTYATALLETLDFLSDSPPAAPLLASGVGRVADLKRRLTMIMRGTTPKTLGWRGCVAVLGMGALMLPLLPAWARAQVEWKVEKADDAAGVVHVLVGSDDGGQDNYRAALKKAEGDLEQKQAEVAALTAKVQTLRARLKAEQTASPAKPGEVVARIDGKGDIVVEVVGDVRYTALQDMLKQLRASQPVAAPGGGVIVLDKASGKIIMKLEGDTPAQPQRLIMVPMGASSGTAGPGGGTAGMPPAADSDKRIDELEQRLKGILDEVEKLRRERKEKNPGGGAGAPAGSGAPVLSRVPYLDRLFVNVYSSEQEHLNALEARAAAEAARHDALEKTLKDFKARAAREDEHGSAASAEFKAKLAQADVEVKLAEKKWAEVQAKYEVGAISKNEFETARAELDARRTNLAQVEAQTRQQIAQFKAALTTGEKRSQPELELELKGCEEILKRLREEMSKLKNAPAGADGPAEPKSKSAPKDSDEVSAAFSTADSYFNEGEYQTALKLYNEIAERHPKEESGVKALGGTVRCLMALGRKKEVSQRLQEIKGRLDVLPKDAKTQWEKWLEVATPEVPW